MRLGAIEQRIVDVLTRGPRPTETLMQAVWGHDRNDGPDDMAGALRVHISKLRRKGFVIESTHKHHYRLRFDPRQSLVEGARWMQPASEPREVTKVL
jgi:DNA-binding response OmpR family regulator